MLYYNAVVPRVVNRLDPDWLLDFWIADENIGLLLDTSPRLV